MDERHLSNSTKLKNKIKIDLETNCINLQKFAFSLRMKFECKVTLNK